MAFQGRRNQFTRRPWKAIVPHSLDGLGRPSYHIHSTALEGHRTTFTRRPWKAIVPEQTTDETVENIATYTQSDELAAGGMRTCAIGVGARRERHQARQPQRRGPTIDEQSRSGVAVGEFRLASGLSSQSIRLGSHVGESGAHALGLKRAAMGRVFLGVSTTKAGRSRQRQDYYPRRHR